jgi:hypothetical protein
MGSFNGTFVEMLDFEALLPLLEFLHDLRDVEFFSIV